MKITKVRIKKIENENSSVKALVEVTLDNCFVVKEIRIIEKPEKMIVAMPSKTINSHFVDVSSDTKKLHKDLVHPINQETRDMFNNVILSVYERANETVYTEEFDD